MPGVNLLGSQVKKLLAGVSDHGSHHLTEIEIDLAQTSVLLAEAIQKLGASFMAVHAAVCVQQETVDLMLSDVVPSPELAAKLVASRTEIGQHVNAAVTGLQFQDMTDQLIGRTMARIAGLRDVLDTLGIGSANLISDSESAEIEAIVKSVNDLVMEKSLRLGNASWKAVSQTHMDSGDIELF
jgi:hypothetical protein